MLAAIAVLAVLTVVAAGTWLAAAVIARHRAQSAADLAAVAAAVRLPAGDSAACALADTVVRSMGGTVRQCSITRLDVIVVVSVRAGGRLGREALAAARAGPA